MAITTATQAGQILNQALRDLGYEYQIDLSTGDTIEEGFKSVGAFPESQKNALLQQANAILVFRNYGTMFNESKNPTRRFWRADMNYGGGIEDIYHEIIAPVEGFWADDYADAVNDDELSLNIAKDLVKFHRTNVEKKFHTNIDRFTIPVSITELEISKIFTPEGFARYVDVKLANIQWSAEVKLQNIAIEAVRQMVVDQKIKFKTGYNLNDDNGVTGMVEDIQTATDAMKNLSEEYNYSEVLTISDEEDLFLFTTPSFMNRLRVRGYANAFNLKEYALKNKVIMLPEGTTFGNDPTGNPVHAVLLDRRAVVLSIRYWKMRTFKPANTDYDNYFLKVQYLHGYNEFFNAVAFSGEPVSFFTETAGELTKLYITARDDNYAVINPLVNGERLVGERITDDIVYTVANGAVIEFANPAISKYYVNDSGKYYYFTNTDLPTIVATGGFIEISSTPLTADNPDVFVSLEVTGSAYSNTSENIDSNVWGINGYRSVVYEDYSTGKLGVMCKAGDLITFYIGDVGLYWSDVFAEMAVKIGGETIPYTDSTEDESSIIFSINVPSNGVSCTFELIDTNT